MSALRPNHRRLDCLLSRLFRRRSEKSSKLLVTGLCEGNPPVTVGFSSHRSSYAEDVSIWWRHHAWTSLLDTRWAYKFEICSAYLAPLAGDSPIYFPHQRGSIADLYVGPNKLLNEQSSCQYFETPWRVCQVMEVMFTLHIFMRFAARANCAIHPIFYNTFSIMR